MKINQYVLCAMLAVSLTAAASSSSSSSAELKLRPDNIDQIVKAMTLQEKAELLVGSIEGTNYFGIPQSTGSDPNSRVLVEGAAGQTNLLSRLGIPSTVVADGPAGVRINPTRHGTDKTYYATGFPVGILLASTFDQEMLDSVGRAFGAEIRDYGVDVILGPGMNVMRSPLCGRNFEYFSEDPLLAGKSAAAIVRGIQSQGVGTSVKHFAANNQETNRNFNDSRLDQRTLREIYLRPFEIVIKEGKPWTVMSSYNKLNGTFTQENRELLTDLLRDEWGYDGIVMTDWTAQRNTSAQVAAGNDLMMPGTKGQIEQIVEDVKSGVLSEKDVDACVRRMLQYIVKTPRFRGFQYNDSPDFASHAVASRQAASDGMVLLKNDNRTLPLSAPRKVALFGNTGYRFLPDGSGSGHVSTAHTVNLVEGLGNAGFALNDTVGRIYGTYFEAEDARNAYSPMNKIPFLKMIGIEWRPEEYRIPSYVADGAAQQADVAIITIGRKPGEGFDRTVEGDFNLTNTEREMITNVSQAFHAAGKPVVVILNVGGVVETASWRDQADAILLAWMPGQEGGNVVADVLTGKVNPSGRLPITFPVSYTDVPSAADFPQGQPRVDDGMMGLSAILKPQSREGKWEKNIEYTDYAEGVNVGYRHYTTHGVPVAYPFGYGQSYTEWKFENLTAKAKKGGVEVALTIKNIGEKAGREVAQIYVSAPKGTLDKPLRELRAFGKTRLLQPGESQTLTMFIPDRDLSSFSIDRSAWVTDAGTYTVEACRDADTPVLTANVEVKKAKTWPVKNILAPKQD